MFKKALSAVLIAVSLIGAGCSGSSSSPDPALTSIVGFWDLPLGNLQQYQAIDVFGRGMAYIEDTTNNCFNTVATQYVHLSDDTFRRSYPNDAAFPPEDFEMVLLPNGSLQLTAMGETSQEWVSVSGLVQADVVVCTDMASFNLSQAMQRPKVASKIGG